MGILRTLQHSRRFSNMPDCLSMLCYLISERTLYSIAINVSLPVELHIIHTELR